jgi:C-terminal processing protease CtpA/Prc
MPPRLEIALLRNDEGSHTMTVARSFNEQRWPLLHGDRILEVEGAGKVSTLTDLVSALRGRTGPIGLQVERAGTRSRVVVSPALRATNLTRRGVELDGALIGPIRFDDEWLLREPIRLLVMSIAPGSAAEARGLEAGDYLQAVDGRRFEDVDSLFAYAHDKHAAVEVVVLRWAPGWLRLYDHHVRELPGESARIVTDETSTPELAGR